MLIENALSTQDRVLQVFPNMDTLITQEETQSIEDLAAVLLSQVGFLLENAKDLNSRLQGDYLSILNKRLISENDQLKQTLAQCDEIIKDLQHKTSERESQIELMSRSVASPGAPAIQAPADMKRATSRERRVAARELNFEVGQLQEALAMKKDELKNTKLLAEKHRQQGEAFQREAAKKDREIASLKELLQARSDQLRVMDIKLTQLIDKKTVEVSVNIA